MILQLSGIHSELEPIECTPTVERNGPGTICWFNDQSSTNKDVSRIKVIPSMFQGQYIKGSSVSAILFSFCNFNNIPTVVYSSFVSIWNIQIRFSNIGNIGNEDFKAARDLRNFYVIKSKIGEISAKAFSSARSLENILIEDSEIESFSPDAFDDLENLKSATLKNNKYSQGTPKFNNPRVIVILS